MSRAARLPVRSIEPLLRRAGLATAVSLGTAVPLAAVASWIGAKILTDAPRPRERRPRHTARFHSPATAQRDLGYFLPVVELDGPDADLPGIWGLALDGGFARIHDPLEHNERGVVRPYEVLAGTVPTAESQEERRQADRRSSDDSPQNGHNEQPVVPDGRRQTAGRRARREPGPWPVRVVLSPHAWPADPQILARATGAQLMFDAVPAPGGYLPAWVFRPPDDAPALSADTWMIAVHGRGSRRSETFSLVDIALRSGVTAVVASYRTDQWTRQPATLTTLGHTEWEDVEACVQLARSRGAQRIVVAGISLGGAITAMLLRRSVVAHLVSGVVLDSPALSWGPTLRHLARSMRLPGPTVPLIMRAAKVRARLDWDVLDHVASAADFSHPILLFHGDEDGVVPVLLSDAFAAARPDLVTYHRIAGAGHVGSWNSAPERYEHAVRDFLRRVSESAPPVPTTTTMATPSTIIERFGHVVTAR